MSHDVDNLDGEDKRVDAIDWMTLLQRCFDADRVHYTQHARFEMEAEAFGRIRDDEVCQAVSNGELIWEYSDDKPYPSVLLLGRTRQNRPLHVVCAYDAGENRAFIITVYQPDPIKWIDFKIRRTT